jgi:hypothetical protein
LNLGRVEDFSAGDTELCHAGKQYRRCDQHRHDSGADQLMTGESSARGDVRVFPLGCWALVFNRGRRGQWTVWML